MGALIYPSLAPTSDSTFARAYPLGPPFRGHADILATWARDRAGSDWESFEIVARMLPFSCHIRIHRASTKIKMAHGVAQDFGSPTGRVHLQCGFWPQQRLARRLMQTDENRRATGKKGAKLTIKPNFDENLMCLTRSRSWRAYRGFWRVPGT